MKELWFLALVAVLLFPYIGEALIEFPSGKAFSIIGVSKWQGLCGIVAEGAGIREGDFSMIFEKYYSNGLRFSAEYATRQSSDWVMENQLGFTIDCNNGESYAVAVINNSCRYDSTILLKENPCIISEVKSGKISQIRSDMGDAEGMIRRLGGSE